MKRWSPAHVRVAVGYFLGVLGVLVPSVISLLRGTLDWSAPLIVAGLAMTTYSAVRGFWLHPPPDTASLTDAIDAGEAAEKPSTGAKGP